MCGYYVRIENWNLIPGIAPIEKTSYYGINAPGTVDFHFQTVSGGISGTITDNNSDPLHNAWVTVHSIDNAILEH